RSSRKAFATRAFDGRHTRLAYTTRSPGGRHGGILWLLPCRSCGCDLGGRRAACNQDIGAARGSAAEHLLDGGVGRACGESVQLRTAARLTGLEPRGVALT